MRLNWFIVPVGVLRRRRRVGLGLVFGRAAGRGRQRDVRRAARRAPSATSRSTSCGSARTTTGPWSWPREKSVLGDFNDTTFTYQGVTTRFFRRDGKFMVNTEGPDGKHHDYEIKYTFGVRPLQQYMVEFPDGRVQVLRESWDVENKKWFYVTPPDVTERADPAGRPVPLDRHRAELEHHLRRLPFDERAQELRPGDEHVQHDVRGNRRQLRGVPRAGQRARRSGAKLVAVLGSQHRLRPADAEGQEPQRAARNVREVPRAAVPGSRGLSAGPAVLGLLRAVAAVGRGLYHADGQILDEVYEYGSFLQSKMHANHVRCTDCHDPHSLQAEVHGQPAVHAVSRAGQVRYAGPSSSPGRIRPARSASSATCRRGLYMVIDERRDHSFRVPRPDLSVELGTPNACNDCHTKPDETPSGRPTRCESGTARSGRTTRIGRRRSRPAARRSPKARSCCSICFAQDDAGDRAGDGDRPVGAIIDRRRRAKAQREALYSSDPLVRLTAVRAIPIDDRSLGRRRCGAHAERSGSPRAAGGRGAAGRCAARDAHRRTAKRVRGGDDRVSREPGAVARPGGRASCRWRFWIGGTAASEQAIEHLRNGDPAAAVFGGPASELASLLASTAGERGRNPAAARGGSRAGRARRANSRPTTRRFSTSSACCGTCWTNTTRPRRHCGRRRKGAEKLSVQVGAGAAIGEAVRAIG